MALVDTGDDEKRGRRWRWVLLAVVLLPVAAIGVLVASFDPEDYKPQILAAVQEATGRELTIEGRLHLSLALRPTIAAERVRFANATGGSRPEMVSLERIEARIALLPLLQHRLEIDSLTLARPNVLLEPDAQGRGNWSFGEAAPPSPVPTSRPAKSAPPSDEFFVRALRITDGTLTWRDGRSGTSTTVGLRQADFAMESASAPISILLDAAWNENPVQVSGHVGSLNGLQGQSAAPWPLRLVLAVGKAKLNVSGTVASPAQGKGYQIKLDGSAPNLAALAPLASGLRLPHLRDVTFAAEIADRGAALPEISGLSLRAGPSDLEALLPGLKLTRLDVATPRVETPMRVTAEGSLNGAAVAVAATLGAPTALLGLGDTKSSGPMPLDMALSAADARLTIKGAIAEPASWSGVDLAVRATIPDLAALGRLRAVPLPDLQGLTMQAQLLSPRGGMARGVVLKDLRLTQAAIDLAGEATIGLSPRASIQANLTSGRIDVDALRAAVGVPDAASSTRAAPADGAKGRVIPDTPLPFDLLNVLDGDVRWRVKELVQGGKSTRNVDLHAKLAGGKLRLDPFTATLPAGSISGSLSVDATQANPAVALVALAPGLDIRQLYQALERDGAARGKVELDLELRGAGHSARAIAATATGHLGVAAADGAIDNRLLNQGLLGGLLRGINQGDLLGRDGTTELRCFALRIDANSGAGEVRALLLDASTLSLEGGGGLNLGDETLALQLRAQPKLLGLGIAIPLRVGGSFAAPRVLPSVGGTPGAVGQTVQSTAETAVGIVGGGVGAVGSLLGGALGGAGKNAGQAITPTDACATQLAIARGGRAGPVPTPAASTTATTPKDKPAPQRRSPPNPLERLFRR